jgi:hypothetical protein
MAKGIKDIDIRPYNGFEFQGKYYYYTKIHSIDGVDVSDRWQHPHTFMMNGSKDGLRTSGEVYTRECAYDKQKGCKNDCKYCYELWKIANLSKTDLFPF